MPESAVPTRRATREDVEALVRLVNLAYQGEPSLESWTSEASIVFGPRVTSAAIEGRLATADGAVLVVDGDAGAPLAGCVHIERRGDSGYIGLLSVHPRAQSRRLGTRLLHAAEAHVRDALGLDRAIVWVVSARDELAAWYERAGYVRTGETHPFPPEEARVPGLHFVVLRRAPLFSRPGQAPPV